MTSPDSWQENNARKLSLALAELRQRLEEFCQRSESSHPGVTRPDATAAAPEKSADPDLPSALDLLSERLGLAAFERNILLLCAAMELDTRIAGLCARAQEDAQKNFPTFALALALFDEAFWGALSPQRALRYWRLIEISQFAGQSLTTSALRTDERIVHYLKGLNYLDDRLSSLCQPLNISADAHELSVSQEIVVQTILRRWRQSAEHDALPIVQLVGSDPQSKHLVAYRACAELNRQLHRLTIESLPTSPADLDLLSRLYERESRLLPLALYLDAEELNGPLERSSALSRFLSRTDGLFFLGTRETLPHLERPNFSADVARPTNAEQEAAWTAELDDQTAGMPARLVSQFNLNLARIHQLGGLARAESQDSNLPASQKTWAICRASERPRMDALAQRLEPKVSWDDLVLPAEQTCALKQIAAQVAHRHQVYHEWGFERKMNRGFGISVLFAGDSGTGKTMAAEVIANELELDLYRIDLSAVVNKYIGETEKNLRRVFDAAEEGGAILFFDEADALFGKRSEVKDSHDRYANVEINYLLQRIESYHGLAILATNMKSALDTAFLRRLRFVINFPYPTLADRRRLWEKVFLQPGAKNHLAAPPLDDLDYERLAKLNLAGGNIHNAALNAAFQAAAQGSNVTMPLVFEAIRTELRKLDRPINEADFDLESPGTLSRVKNGHLILQ